jgi:glutamine amidotransferase
MITIIDYGMGNLGSISNMVKKVGGKSRLSCLKDEILNAEKVILPGVGSFDQAMINLESLQLVEVIKEIASKGVPIMGICLGMQLLANYSEEGVLPGLGLIKGRVLSFDKNNDLKVPHMGWNLIEYNPKCSLFNDFEQFDETRFYFVHSYYFKCDLDENVAATTNYGINFTSAVYNKNVMGSQFHPEKSHKYGMQLIKNLIDL